MEGAVLGEGLGPVGAGLDDDGLGAQVQIKLPNDLGILAATEGQPLVLPGENEGLTLCGSKDPQVIGKFYLDLGAKTVIVKTGADGAETFTKDGSFHTPAYPPEKIVDTVGAGDGFAAGVESALMEGLSLEEAVRRGSAIGTIQIMHVSDNEGLPTREELEKFMAENKQK